MRDNAAFIRFPAEMSLPPAFILKKLLSLVLLPPVMPLLCIAAGLLLWRRHPRLGRAFAWGGLLLVWLLSTPATLNLLIAPLEDIPVLQAGDLARAQAIVILGAGVRRHLPEYDGPAPNRLLLERLRYGARLARSSGLPVLVSGGAPTGRVAEAQVMAASLQEDFGIEVRWREDASLDTADNASMSAALLRSSGIQRIVLVTHAAHMRRSVGEFAAKGLEVMPAPTGYLVERDAETDLFYYLPGATAAYNSWYAAHEGLGLLVQKLRLAWS